MAGVTGWAQRSRVAAKLPFTRAEGSISGEWFRLALPTINGPCHWLDDAGKAWLWQNADKIELPYSPEFNPTEGVWKVTRKMATKVFSYSQPASGVVPR